MSVRGTIGQRHVRKGRTTRVAIASTNKSAAHQYQLRQLIPVAATIQTLQQLIRRETPGSPVAMYLTGSFCDGGLRRESDLDILLITRVRYSWPSGAFSSSTFWATRGDGHQAAGPTSRTDLPRPGRHPALALPGYARLPLRRVAPNRLRGWPPTPPRGRSQPSCHPHVRPSALLRAHGPPLAELTDPVPREHLTQSMFDALPSLLDDLVGDERNVLLTLARILYTLRTGLIAPKDVAAADVCSILAPAPARTLDLAARAYSRGEVRDD